MIAHSLGSKPIEGIGGELRSPAALSRIARGELAEQRPPSFDDLAAVHAWRTAVHEAWGEHDSADHPHVATTIGGVPCLTAGREGAPTVVYVHGGGYVLGSPGVAVPITARFARSMRVVSVGYRLAPEFPYPAGLDDVVAVAEAIGADGPFAIAGESAGGGLAVAAALRLHAERRAEPCALALLCPHLQHDASEPFSRAYLGGVHADEPLASPLCADLRNLPPTLIQGASNERLFTQAVRFARAGRAAGVEVSLDVWEQLWHTWHYHPDVPEAGRAIDEAAAFLVARTPPARP